MEGLFYFLLDFNYVKAIYILLLCYVILQWILLFKNKDYVKYNRQYSQLTPNDIYRIKHVIKFMSGREFEELCELLFKKCGKYSSVILTQAERDGGKDIILDNRIYVECKRYTENATVTEDFMIGREICQKLVGAMIGDGFREGLIVTTGNIHRNAWDYINNLEKNAPDIKIDFMLQDDIMKMIREINSTEILEFINICEKENDEILE